MAPYGPCLPHVLLQGVNGSHNKWFLNTGSPAWKLAARLGFESLRDLFPAPWGVDCDENTIKDYVKGQGLKYQKIHEDRQLALF